MDRVGIMIIYLLKIVQLIQYLSSTCLTHVYRKKTELELVTRLINLTMYFA